MLVMLSCLCVLTVIWSNIICHSAARLPEWIINHGHLVLSWCVRGNGGWGEVAGDRAPYSASVWTWLSQRGTYTDRCCWASHYEVDDPSPLYSWFTEPKQTITADQWATESSSSTLLTAFYQYKILKYTKKYKIFFYFYRKWDLSHSYNTHMYLHISMYLSLI